MEHCCSRTCKFWPLCLARLARKKIDPKVWCSRDYFILCSPWARSSQRWQRWCIFTDLAQGSAKYCLLINTNPTQHYKHDGGKFPSRMTMSKFLETSNKRKLIGKADWNQVKGIQLSMWPLYDAGNLNNMQNTNIFPPDQRIILALPNYKLSWIRKKKRENYP